MIAIPEPSPEVDLPCQAPSRTAIAPEEKRLAGSVIELRRFLPVDFTPRMQSPQMRNVAMSFLGIIFIFKPLLQLSVFTDLIRSNTFILSLQSVSECRIDAKYFTCCYRIFKKVPN